MSLWIIHKNRGIKTFRDKVNLIEKHYGSPLRPYQILLLWFHDKYRNVKNGAL